MKPSIGRIALLLLLLPLAGMAQDISIRLGPGCEGSSTPKCGVHGDFVLGAGATRQLYSVETRYLPDGTLVNSFSGGVERDLPFGNKYIQPFLCGQVGLDQSSEATTGAGRVCAGLVTSQIFRLGPVQGRLVPTGWGVKSSAQGGAFGGFSLTVQVDFKKQ